MSVRGAVEEAVRLISSVPGRTGRTPADHIDRIEFDVSLVLSGLDERAGVVDLGGGLGLFSLALALLGVRSLIADDFQGWSPEEGAELIDALERTGVEVIQRDLLAEPLGIAAQSLGAVTSFHFLEHLHRSPRDLFLQGVDALVPGGTFIVAGPNCVNARKRLTVPFGHGTWSPMHQWYDAPTFGGHVREPSVEDLAYIARDLGLVDIETHGRNFIGAVHGGMLGRVSRLADPFLRMRPSLCSDIYAVGRKQGVAN